MYKLLNKRKMHFTMAYDESHLRTIRINKWIFFLPNVFSITSWRMTYQVDSQCPKGPPYSCEITLELHKDSLFSNFDIVAKVKRTDNGTDCPAGILFLRFQNVEGKKSDQYVLPCDLKGNQSVTHLLEVDDIYYSELLINNKVTFPDDMMVLRIRLYVLCRHSITERQDKKTNPRPEQNEGNPQEQNVDNQPEHNEGNQPEYNKGNQPEYNKGNQPEHEGNQPEYNKGNQPEHNKGNQPEHNEGNQPEQNANCRSKQIAAGSRSEKNESSQSGHNVSSGSKQNVGSQLEENSNRLSEKNTISRPERLQPARTHYNSLNRIVPCQPNRTRYWPPSGTDYRPPIRQEYRSQIRPEQNRSRQRGRNTNCQ